MLRKIRTILAAVFFVLITLLFLDFTGTLHHWLSWLAKIQFLPAVMALNVGVIVALVLLTPGTEPTSPAMAGGFFTTEPPGKPSIRMVKNNHVTSQGLSRQSCC